MRAILPVGVNLDAELHAWLGQALDPERRVLAALERIVPLAGKRIADVGTGIGHYPMLLARHTGRTYGIESEPDLLAVARQRAEAAHQPNLRIVEGTPDRLPLRDGAVDIVLHGSIEPTDAALPLIAEALRVLRPGGRLVVIGYYGRDDLSALLEPERVSAALEATRRGAGWWPRHGFKIKVVHARLDLGDPEAAQRMLPRLYGDRGLARLMGAPTTSLRIRLGLYHLAAPGQHVMSSGTAGPA
ncbi:MAG TPA: class I SAM-dependent methyltransferase [Candidatus Limnocylindria bacterium]|nr:class I SAM-dependent methyltransferase [Candidatus Limnocylindria bacterium]